MHKRAWRFCLHALIKIMCNWTIDISRSRQKMFEILINVDHRFCTWTCPLERRPVSSASIPIPWSSLPCQEKENIDLLTEFRKRQTHRLSVSLVSFLWGMSMTTHNTSHREISLILIFCLYKTKRCVFNLIKLNIIDSLFSICLDCSI